MQSGVRDELGNLKHKRVGDCDNSDSNFVETQKNEKQMLTGMFKEKQLEGL